MLSHWGKYSLLLIAMTIHSLRFQLARILIGALQLLIPEGHSQHNLSLTWTMKTFKNVTR